MTPIEALITLARRYCLDNYTYWSTKYTQERTGNDIPYTYSDNDYDLFPRYNVLFAILDQVEGIVEQTFPDLHTCKNKLKNIGLTADTVFTTGEQNNIASSAMLDERRKFILIIDNVDINDLEHVAPLPYRRRLTSEESESIRRGLLDNWNYDGGLWEPLREISPKPVLFLMRGNLTDSDCESISHTVGNRVSNKVFEITEDHRDALVDVDELDLDCYETVYCDESFEWVIYGSHESTLSFGGAWLIDFINQLYSDREELLNKYDESI